MLIKDLPNYHTEWLNIVKSFGAKTDAEDIVQDMYIRIYKYADNKTEVSKSYIWVTLRNIFFYNYKNEIKTIELNNLHTYIEEDSDELWEKIDTFVERETSKWQWFEKNLFNVYLTSGKSMRDLEKETNISVTTIFHTIKKCKTKLKKQYEDEKT
jgi:DNA-directed RNA polymerase specialized sigma24 family protein